MDHPLVDAADGDATLADAGGLPLAEEAAGAAGGDALDDVFGSPMELLDEQHVSHPSDVGRLRTEHTTAGYREGITLAKESSIQAGFDEGFGLGATLGSRAGLLLGVLEGISDALSRHGDEGAAAAAPAAEKRLVEAREELCPSRIFSPDYWEPDGNWAYPVLVVEGEDILFPHVADAHPLIRKWSTVVDEQVELWNISMGLLEDEVGPRVALTSNEEPLASSPLPATKQALDW
ncbi:hypothetical protein RJ55_06054 [Drechmeria coniospora]|nr:hypothetical protein RJ55_06054 [Drechmeria coniospora]